MGDMTEWYEFAAPQLLATELARAVATRLEDAIADRGHALLAVSGGSTPATFFRALARKPLNWSAVTVILVDERFVPASSERSNERLVTLNLLQADAAAAAFAGLYGDGDIDDVVDQACERISELRLPIDVTVLGMGTDGHTASFFADAGNLPELLDPNGAHPVLAVQSKSAGEARLTLTMAALRTARNTYIHIEGLPKKELLLDILGGNSTAPMRSIFDQALHPIDIYWAPGETS